MPVLGLAPAVADAFPSALVTLVTATTCAAANPGPPPPLPWGNWSNSRPNHVTPARGMPQLPGRR
ncbi:hypothetical protein A8926_5694 [Saccharopolyspora spinosa]|uniref:Uncharacterized protein n=1 Tax=Saccharopolyspora spinosa TaxID=60894 RepID=A0A2N3Y449_SACSN|nr:hypothetical protein A8926_5694 [Saccharopolyspora spinosa]